MDTDSKSEHRKNHVHLILVFPNTTTYAHALNVFKLLGEKATNTCRACVSIRNCYDYLIHDTDTCRKQGKFQYPPECRIVGNNFDIGAYEQMSQEEKQERLAELIQFIKDRQFFDISTFTFEALEVMGKDYWEIIIAYNAILDRYCSSEWKKWQRENFWRVPSEEDFRNTPTCEKITPGTRQCCPDCGSIDFIKKGKTAAQTPRFKCKDCEKVFIF